MAENPVESAFDTALTMFVTNTQVPPVTVEPGCNINMLEYEALENLSKFLVEKRMERGFVTREG